MTKKKPIPTENSKTNGQHKNATKNFDCTTIADRHPTGVVKPRLKGTNISTHRKSSVINRTWQDRNIVYNTNGLTRRLIYVKI